MARLNNPIRLSESNLNWLRIKKVKLGVKTQNAVISFLIKYYIRQKRKNFEKINQNENENED